MNTFINHLMRVVLVAVTAFIIAGCASGKHGGGVGGTGNLIGSKSGGGVGGTGGHVAGKSGGGIGGTGGHLAGKSGGGIGGTGNLIAEGGGIGGTGLQAPDLMGGGFRAPNLPSSPLVPQVVESPQTPQQIPDVMTPPQVPQTVPVPDSPQTQIARETSSPGLNTPATPNATPPQVEAGAGVPALGGDEFRAPDEGQDMAPALPALGPEAGDPVPPEMMEPPTGMINCPDLIRMDPNCQAPRPGR